MNPLTVRTLLFLVGLLFFASGQANVPVQAATTLLPADIQSLAPSGPRVAELGRFSRVAVEGQTFAEAMLAETIGRPAYPWDVQLGARLIAPVAEGDTLWVGFVARRVTTLQETGEALVEVIVEQSARPHAKLLERAISVGPRWTQIAIPFVADRSAATGELQLTLRLGYNPQSLELADVRLLNHGPGVPIASLPRTDTSYEGSAPDHPWRSAAAERIDRLRKANLAVRVLDTTGHPVPGARVEVRMRRHAFGFGTAVQAARFGGPEADTPDNVRYRDTIERYFNKIVFENDLKWPQWAEDSAVGHERRAWIDRTLAWAAERAIPARGHVMVWPSWRYLPRSLRALENDPPALGAAVLAHICDQTAALGSRLAEWDVVNETYAHHQLLDLLGREAMADWFRAARSGAPDTRLYYNDYTLFSGEGPGSPSQHFHDTVRFLLEQGAPLGGIGEQGHFGGSPPPPPRVLEVLDRFSIFGLPIQITEFDIDTSDIELQVAYTRDFLTAVFSHPSVDAVMCWGFWEGSHWKPRAAFWARDWTLRPNGRAFLDLVFREWWTDVDLVTDAEGQARLRAFRGEHEIATRLPDGRSVTRRVTLGGEGLAVDLTLP